MNSTSRSNFTGVKYLGACLAFWGMTFALGIPMGFALMLLTGTMIGLMV